MSFGGLATFSHIGAPSGCFETVKAFYHLFYMLVLISRDLLLLASLHTVTILYALLERTSSHLYRYSKAEMQLWETSVNSHLHIPKLKTLET